MALFTRNKDMSLDEALDYWSVHDPGMFDSEQGPAGWWAVSSGMNGIVAYFSNEQDACRYRLFMINRELNP